VPTATTATRLALAAPTTCTASAAATCPLAATWSRCGCGRCGRRGRRRCLSRRRWCGLLSRRCCCGLLSRRRWRGCWSWRRRRRLLNPEVRHGIAVDGSATFPRRYDRVTIKVAFRRILRLPGAHFIETAQLYCNHFGVCLMVHRKYPQPPGTCTRA